MIETVPTAAFGAAAALSLGVTDFLARFATRRMGARTTGALMYGGGAVLFTLAALLSGAAFPLGGLPAISAVASGLAGGLGILCFYTAIARGQLAFVIPIAASFPVWSVLYTVVVEGVRFSMPLLVAVAVTLCGSALVARYGVMDEERAASAGRRLEVAALTLAAAVFFVVSLQVAELAVAESSAAGTVAVSRASGFLVLLAAALHAARGPTGPLLPGVLFVVPMAALDGFANLVIFAVIERAESALAIVLAGAFGVVTVLLGRLFLAETVSRPQTIGIAMALGGAIAVSAIGG